jgi:hypothetical protein
MKMRNLLWVADRQMSQVWPLTVGQGLISECFADASLAFGGALSLHFNHNQAGLSPTIVSRTVMQNKTSF